MISRLAISHHAPPQGLAAANQPGQRAGTPIPGLVSALGVYVPLVQIDPKDPYLGGYQWLEPTDAGQTYHPGVDLNSRTGGSGSGCNADEGLPVVVPVAGTVQAVLYWDGSTPGEGNHVWIELDGKEQSWTGGTSWMHVDHLKTIICGVGDQLAAGDPIGSCGRTGCWACAHLHWELAKARPASWTQWPRGWTRARVEQTYWSPAAWFSRTLAEAALLVQQPGGAMGLLTDDQARAVATAVWGATAPFVAGNAIPESWLTEWRAGRYRGEPVEIEQAVPDLPGGVYQQFEHGIAVYAPGRSVSWTG